MNTSFSLLGAAGSAGVGSSRTDLPATLPWCPCEIVVQRLMHHLLPSTLWVIGAGLEQQQGKSRVWAGCSELSGDTALVLPLSIYVMSRVSFLGHLCTSLVQTLTQMSLHSRYKRTAS